MAKRRNYTVYFILSQPNSSPGFRIPQQKGRPEGAGRQTAAKTQNSKLENSFTWGLLRFARQILFR